MLPMPVGRWPVCWTRLRLPPEERIGEITPDGTGGSLHVKSGLDILPNAPISMGELNKRKLEIREGY